MIESAPSPPKTIWTIGHSNREIEAFVAMLAGASIEAVADVRRFPGSRRLPQFNRDELERSLAEAGVAYRHLPDLGGRRGDRTAESPNVGWRVASFNAYADHMGTPAFLAALDELQAFARERRTTTMCSEALPWRCHRRLISDALIVRGWSVLDVIGPTSITPHALTDFAEVEGERITYP